MHCDRCGDAAEGTIRLHKWGGGDFYETDIVHHACGKCASQVWGLFNG